ncbi:hypothetical protein CsSME_00042079 [Camellia sinensis var. sinensis]
MTGVTENPSIVTDETTQRDDLTPTNMLGRETITSRHALNFASPSTSEHETMQAIMEQAKQNEQRLENMIAENERLRQDLALEVAKSKQAVCPEVGRPLRAGGRRPQARRQDTDRDFDSLSSEPKKKE